ncbi:hypothetical protein SAMN05444008_11539 [Cnuella takakiae]|uniref:Uncharacterized protein n=1 Tax=Cnuella takakiae TaxID=1302690 RepID=A0A1M5FZS4_9BACT|nr:hypothetical protein [Cnuella takakiae]OLY92275.1 hypothetical protein BUE76_10515 [Cnuella takakiae]SHF96969.1 hypothetical protein SAMN05444008_11539 [Cnuella takakiae]
MRFNDYDLPVLEVLDIGPLQEEQHPDEVEALGYGAARYYYWLRLKTGTYKIISPWFLRINREGRRAMQQWRDQYWDARRHWVFALH